MTRDEDDGELVISQEYAVLDRAGRLQLPKSFVAALGMRERVRLELEGDHISIWPESPSAGRMGEKP